VFLGFTKDSDACKFLGLGTNSIIEARDAEFFEDKFIKDKDLSLKDAPKMYLKIQKSLLYQMSQSLQKQKVPILKKTPEATELPSKRIRKQDFGDDFITYNVEGDPLIFKKAMSPKMLFYGRKP